MGKIMLNGVDYSAPSGAEGNEELKERVETLEGKTKNIRLSYKSIKGDN